MNEELKNYMREFIVADDIREELKQIADTHKVDYLWLSDILDIVSERMMDLEDMIQAGIAGPSKK